MLLCLFVCARVFKVLCCVRDVLCDAVWFVVFGWYRFVCCCVFVCIVLSVLVCCVCDLLRDVACCVCFCFVFVCLCAMICLCVLCVMYCGRLSGACFCVFCWGFACAFECVFVLK